MAPDPFALFASDRLGASVYRPILGSDEDAIFAVSLESARAHIAWTLDTQDRDGRPFAVEAGYLDRMTPNAVADRVGGTHFIGFHQALLVTVVEFALFAFTQQGVFPEIGNAAGEASPVAAEGQAPGVMLLEKTLAGGSITTSADTQRVPKDPERHVAAIYLALLMARFVWVHELAHCYRGHVGLVQAEGLSLRLYEVPEISSLVSFARSDLDIARRSLILRGLELDADAAALQGCCAIQLRDLENIDGIKAFGLETRLRLVLFGAYAMTWLFEEYQRFMRSRDAHSHPAPYDRLRNIVAVATAEVGPSIPGFVPLHAQVAAEFDALQRGMPASSGFRNPEDASVPSQRDLDALRAALAPYRFDGEDGPAS